MIGKIKIFLLFIVLILIPINILGENFELYSNNALVYNLTGDEVLYAKNEKEIVSIASLTKIMSVVVSLESIENLDEVVKFPKIGSLSGYSKYGYKYGDKVTYRDLLYSAILPSAADSTEALSILISKSTNGFITLMNDKAKELGMNDTHFASTYGKDSSENYSTLNDLLKLMVYALKNKEFYTIFTTMSYTLTNGETINNSIKYYNRKANLNVAPIIGAKTGFTDIAGYCIISIYKKGDAHLLIITTNANPKLGKPTHLIDSLDIGNYYFENYRYFDVLKKDENIGYIKILGIKEYIYSNENIKLYLDKDTNVKKEFKKLKDIGLKSNLGDKIGEFIISYNGKEIVKDVTIPNTVKVKLLLCLFKYLMVIKWLIIISFFI